MLRRGGLLLSRNVSRAASTAAKSASAPAGASTQAATPTAAAPSQQTASGGMSVLDIAFKTTIVGIAGYTTYMAGILGCITYELLHKDDDPDAPPRFLTGTYYLVYGPRLHDLGQPIRKKDSDR